MVCGANGDSMTISAFDRLARHLRRLGGSLALLRERIKLVDQLHHRRHGGVHLLAHVDVLGDTANGVVRLAAQRPLGAGQRGLIDGACARPTASARH